MTVKEIVKEYLIKNKYDGLCNDRCGCELNDLTPCNCDANLTYCIPAYKHECIKCYDLCVNGSLLTAHGFCMKPTKQEETK